jgi:glutamine amidotransferase
MCELFAMSSRRPAAVTYSLNEFAKHGGLTYSNRSGWGVAYFDDRETFLVKEPRPAIDSPWVKFIASQKIMSACVIAHVRLATVGIPTLRNTHPFRRALGGRVHVFAHNGTIENLHTEFADTKLDYQPVGETDSELAFCILLTRLKKLWENRDPEPTIDARLDMFAEFCADMRRRGCSNFLYSDGRVLFAHADRRIFEDSGKFSKPRPPGLNVRNCMVCQQGPEWHCDGLKIELGDQRTMLLASVPLDESGWEPLPEGTAIGIVEGVEFARRST